MIVSRVVYYEMRFIFFFVRVMILDECGGKLLLDRRSIFSIGLEEV